jgi:DNA-directed RNA polymerase subunit F
MPTPSFVEEKPLSMLDAHSILEQLQKRDIELNHLSNKVKDYLALFMTLTSTQKEELYKKLKALEISRLKEEHMVKIIDFLPRTAGELKAVLQAYPLSLSKKDQESILEVVQKVASRQ